MPIPVFDTALPRLAEALNHTADVLRNIRDTSGDLSWRAAHLEREKALFALRSAWLNLRGLVVDGSEQPIAANLAVLNDRLPDYPGLPSTAGAFQTAMEGIHTDIQAFNVAYATWHDALAVSSIIEWQNPGTAQMTRHLKSALTEVEAAPLRSSTELNDLITAIEAMGG